MANKLVAIRIKQQDGTYSTEIPVGAWADNVAYNTTTTVKQQLDSLLQRYQDISVDVADAVDNWINQNLPDWDPTQNPLLLDDTLTSQDRPPISAAVQKLIAIDEQTPTEGAKLKIDTYNLTTEQPLEDLEILTPADIDDTLSVEGMVADAKATGNAIKNMAAEFDETQSYEVGDYCIKDNVLYKANTATVANDGWIAERWTQITITDEVSNLKESLFVVSEIDLDSEEKYKYIITQNGVWAQQDSQSQAYCNIIPITDTVINITFETTFNNSWIAFMKTANHVNATSVDFSTNYNTRKQVPQNGSLSFTVESDMNYLYVLRSTVAGMDTTPTVMFQHMRTDKTLSEAYVPAEAKVVGDALNKTLAWIDSSEVQAAISAGGILAIDPGKYFTAKGSEIASLFGTGSFPDGLLSATDYIVESYHYGPSNRAYIIRRANGAQIFWGRYNTVSGFEWYDLSPTKDIMVSSYDGGTELHAQTVNTICRVQGVDGITDAPDDVDLNVNVGWLWTYGGSNKQQLLFYPHNSMIYQCIYRNISGTWGWSKWFSVSATPRKTLKILAIGNSFTYSTLGYLPQVMLAMNPNIDFTLGICYDSGESIAGHIEKMTNPTESNPETYAQYSLWKFGASQWTNSANNKTLKWALLSDEWDYIILQEAPTNVTGQANDTDDLKTLANLIMTYMAENNVSHPFSFLYNLPQCYGPNYSGLTTYCTNHNIMGTNNDEKSNNVMKYLTAYAERALKTPYISDVLPGGIAVQNARQIDAFKIIGATGYLYLTNDNIGHLQNGFGPLIAGYANAMKLLELMGEKIPTFFISFIPTNEWLNSSGLYTKSLHGAINEAANTSENFIKAQQCALIAYKNGLTSIYNEEITKKDIGTDPLAGLYDNHFHKIPLIPAGHMDVYKEVDGSIVVDNDDVVNGTEMIPCPKYLVFKAGNTETTERVNIFNKDDYIFPNPDTTSNGVRFTVSDDNESYIINGITDTDAPAYVTLMAKTQSVGKMAAGETYFVDFETDVPVLFRVGIYETASGSANFDHPLVTLYGNGAFTLPASNYYGCAIRIYAKHFEDFNNAKVSFRLYPAVTTQEPSYNSARNIRMYFYEKSGSEYIRRDDVINVVASNGKVNYFNTSTLFNRVVEVPDNTYMQVSTDYTGEFVVYGWDGEHTGEEIGGNGYKANPSGTTNAEYTRVVIPGTTRLLFAKSFAIYEVWGQPAGYYPGTEIVFKGYSGALRMCCALPEGYDYFIAKLRKIDPLTPETAAGTLSSYSAVYNGNLNGEVVAVGKTDIVSADSARSKEIIDAADAIAKIEWDCKAEITGRSKNYKFMPNTKYTGMPYVSRWMTPGELGWHISKHTFINAANDVNSAFYNEHSETGTTSEGVSPGYGTVCSTFAQLCAGWPYPVATDAMPLTPDVIVDLVDNPVPGTVLYNGAGHCVIPEMSINADGIKSYIIYESVNPCTTRNQRLSTRSDSEFRGKSESDIFHTYEYLHIFKYSVHRKDASGYPNSGLYDVYGGNIVNGTARPYRGDRSVMTNLTGVKINIHNETATKLYLQKCTYTAGHRLYKPVPYTFSYFTPTGDAPIEISIPSGADQITVDTSLLEDGAFYGCNTDANSVMEYFEYHEVQPGTYQKTETNFIYNVAKPFWYVCFSNAPAGRLDPKTIYISMPYDADGHYERFRTAMNPVAGREAAAFYKGQLGAYIAPLTEET